VVRLIDVAALGVGVWLVGTLLLLSGWSRSLWARPEHVFLLLLGICSSGSSPFVCSLRPLTLERSGDVVTIVRADRSKFRHAVAAEAGPHLLLRRL
jgi:hypothetical protein